MLEEDEGGTEHLENCTRNKLCWKRITGQISVDDTVNAQTKRNLYIACPHGSVDYQHKEVYCMYVCVFFGWMDGCMDG